MKIKNVATTLFLLLLFAANPSYSQNTATLDAPSEINAGAEFKVKWTGPDNKGDFITIVESEAEERKYGNYKYTKFGKVLDIRAPDKPGEYEVRYLDGKSRETLARKSINVLETTSTLDAPSEVEAGSEIKVIWTGPDNKGDFITVVEADTEERKYGNYTYIKFAKKDRDGKNYIKLKVPDSPGDYEIRYLTGQKRLTLARIPVTVEAVNAELKAPEKAEAGSHIKVLWEGPDNKGDFITIVESDTEERKYGNYTYTKFSKKNKEGSKYVEIRVPESSGSYEIRYLTGQSRKTVARVPLTVTSVDADLDVPSEVVAGSEFKVFWEGPDNQGDFITIVKQDTQEGEYGNYTYTKFSKKDRHGRTYVNITAPDTDGSYEVRYLTSQKHITLTRGSIDVVPTDASLKAPDQVVAGENFKVEWEGPDNKGDFIVVARPDSDEGEYLKYAYTKRGNPVKIEAPEIMGAYELRYYTGQTRKTLATRAIEILESSEPGTIKVISAASDRNGITTGLGAIELILDASGSMLQKLDGKTRISIARQAVTGLVKNSLEEGMPFAMRVFGHLEADSCRTDLEIPLAPLNKTDVTNKVQNIQAMNLAKTPIAKSLSLVANDLSGIEGKAVVILVTDGEETCEGDPKEAIQSLKESGYDVRVNIVGFAIDEVMLKETFREWARVGNGSYFDAKNADELGRSISEAIKIPFEVIGKDGDVAATGVLNGESVEVPPGAYSIKILSGETEEISGLEVEPGKHREVILE